MIDDDDLSDLERRMRAKLEAMQAKPTPEDEREKRMIARLLGSKTEAERFHRIEIQPQKSRIDLRHPRTFKPQKPRIHFEYFDFPASEYSFGGWKIERYENGRKVHTHEGSDYEKRDALLIRMQAAGATCKPVVIGNQPPRPIQGRFKDKPKQATSRKDIMAKIGSLTTDDLIEDEEY